jgi:hypothetical protein
MATERLPMRKIKDILRLKWVQERRNRHIARALDVGVASVSRVVHRAAEAGLSWEQVEVLSETELETALYGAEPPADRFQAGASSNQVMRSPFGRGGGEPIRSASVAWRQSPGRSSALLSRDRREGDSR